MAPAQDGREIQPCFLAMTQFAMRRKWFGHGKKP